MSLPAHYAVTEGVLAGAYPGTAEGVRALERSGVTVFVDLTHPSDPLESYERFLDGTRRIAHPIPDMGTPTAGHVIQILDDIDTVRTDGERHQLVDAHVALDVVVPYFGVHRATGGRVEVECLRELCVPLAQRGVVEHDGVLAVLDPVDMEAGTGVGRDGVTGGGKCERREITTDVEVVLGFGCVMPRLLVVNDVRRCSRCCGYREYRQSTATKHR